jgi:hypothetical protein
VGGDVRHDPPSVLVELWRSVHRRTCGCCAMRAELLVAGPACGTRMHAGVVGPPERSSSISLLITQNAAYENWVSTLPTGVQLFVGVQFAVGLRFITVGMLALTLVRSGLKRRDLFLAKSDLSASFQGKPVFRRSIPWWLVGGLLIVIVSGLTTLFLALNTRLAPTALPQLVVNLPLILLAGTLNTFVEEFG